MYLPNTYLTKPNKTSTTNTKQSNTKYSSAHSPSQTKSNSHHKNQIYVRRVDGRSREIKTLHAGLISRAWDSALSSTDHPMAFNTLWAALVLHQNIMIIMQRGKSQQFAAQSFELGHSRPSLLHHLDILQIWPHCGLPFFTLVKNQPFLSTTQRPKSIRWNFSICEKSYI